MLYKDSYLKILIHSNEYEWEKMMNHKFVKDIGNGNLKDIHFENYLEIEHTFVIDAIDHLTMAMYLSKKIESKIIIHKIINGLLNEQNNYFIDVKDNTRTLTKIPEKANLFRNYMKNCSKKGYEEIIVSFLAAESMYNNWCSNELTITKNNLNNYSKWMKIHTTRSFFNQVKFFSQEAREINNSKVPSKKQKKIFRDTLIYEIAFHSSIYN